MNPSQVLYSLFLVGCLFVLPGCVQDKSNPALEAVIGVRDSLKQEYAPDRRVARFDVEIEQADGQLTLTGESDQPEAVALLLDKIQNQGTAVINEITLLPDQTTAATPYAIVNNSVANIRSKPKHSAELATQATLGTVLKVLKITKEWYLVQTPDDYISWVDHGGVVLTSTDQLENWQESEKVVVMVPNGEVYDHNDPQTMLSDVVLGNLLQKIGKEGQNLIVRFPDGRTGRLQQDQAMGYEQWLSELKASGALIERYARQLMGAPYLWGGTSAKGMDCSGFTKTVYFMNGLVIPRDASQQVNAGKTIDPELKFEGLEKGDLLFFGKAATDSTRQRTTHVGIWLGDGEFIHASKRVRISSIDPDSPDYDEFNKNRYLGSQRYLKNIEGNITDLKTRFISK